MSASLLPADLAEALIIEIGDRFADVMGVVVYESMTMLMADHGLSPQQAGQIINLAVVQWCENRDRLDAPALGRV